MASSSAVLLTRFCLWVSWIGFIACSYASYRAGAFQHSPVGTYPYHPPRVLKENFELYHQATIEAQEQDVEILVFPEGGTGWLFSELINTRDAMLPYCDTVPDEASFKSLCEAPQPKNFSQVVEASCMAQKSGLVVVINICEVEYCNQDSNPDCPSDGRFQWNSDLVFSEEGLLLAKYHKSHLFGGASVFDQPPTPDVVSFNTSFGVQFGMFICYDIDFSQPIQALLSQGINNFVFSSAWVNTPPLQTAVQLQQAWSRIYESNLLAANSASNYFVSGGGIYASGLPLNVSFDLADWNLHKLLVADVPLQATKSFDNTPLQWNNDENKLDFHVDIADQPVACAMQSFPQLEGNCVFVNTNNLTAATLYTMKASHEGLDCAANFSFSPALQPLNFSEATYALFVARANLSFPNTIDGILMEVCAFVHCDNPPNCTASYWTSAGDDISMGGSWQVAIQGSGFTDDVAVFPLFSVGNSTLVSPSAIVESSGSTVQISCVRQEPNLFAVVAYGVGGAALDRRLSW